MAHSLLPLSSDIDPCLTLLHRRLDLSLHGSVQPFLLVALLPLVDAAAAVVELEESGVFQELLFSVSAGQDKIVISSLFRRPGSL